MDEDLTWLINLPPGGREAVGFVDFELVLSTLPRLPHDDAYMRGWSEAKEMASRTSRRQPLESGEIDVKVSD